ncbi:ABC transporter ATP-binding protein [Corallococcus sp. Z5C101001]|uniref:ABC transporter ATP-binding protein n=1 Tax=Corallococcus sp. Z5C101001 TaxID=2596829 RepID=UPI001180DC26|nr:ABC transporter ATP-binding protein [Corallococcus sp. Z5C101001]TSC34284.1 ABC transporter ATP-binding protein [Corallococcus sp. Z5C101001]
MSADIPAARVEERSLKGLGALLWLQGSLVAGAALSSTLAAALALVPFFVVARMATAIYATPPDLDSVRSLALVAAGALALRYVLVAAANMLAHVAAFRILHELRLRLAKKLGAVPLSFFSRRGAGELKKTLMDDVNQIEAFVAHHFPDVVAAIIVPLATAVALLSVDWRMALASLVMAPLAVVAMAVAMRDVGKAHQQWNEIQSRMSSALLEYLRGIHVIKTFGLSAQRFGDLSRSIEEGLAWMEGFMRTNGRGYGAFGALIGSSLVVLVPLGGWLYTRGTLSLESLVLFLVLGPQLLMSMMRLLFAWGNVDRIQAGNARIQAILTAPDLETPASVERPAHHGIAFRGVGFRYDDGGPEVLHDVTFEAPAGKVTALVGPSGAGKTTLVRLVPRLWETTNGAVELGGVDVRTLPLDGLLSHIAMVFQEVFLFHGTVRDNLRLARPDATDAQIDAACRAARAYDFIQALPKKYDTLLGERGARLSGGEKQRLSIARALLKDAPVLLLDEATAFADPENEARIQEALSVLCAGRTVLVVAHRLSTIATADHIVVLEGGRVNAQGTHDELLARCALYQRLWRRHTESLDWSLGEPGTAAFAKEVV